MLDGIGERRIEEGGVQCIFKCMLKQVVQSILRHVLLLQKRLLWSVRYRVLIANSAVYMDLPPSACMLYDMSGGFGHDTPSNGENANAPSRGHSK